MLFLRDLPPRSDTNLSVDQPSLYFGELSNDYVLVNTNTDEFHYPEGDDNVSIRYDGTGGLELGSLFRRLLFSLKSRSYEMLVSGQLTRDSRVIYHRDISDRLGTIAPFLEYDSDPYLVIVDGRLFWIRDAYTLTGNYPYSTPVAGGISYIRNSVKAVIDAYNGTTTFYLADPDDPIALTLSKVFPNLLQPLDTMPAEAAESPPLSGRHLHAVDRSEFDLSHDEPVGLLQPGGVSGKFRSSTARKWSRTTQSCGFRVRSRPSLSRCYRSRRVAATTWRRGWSRGAMANTMARC